MIKQKLIFIWMTLLSGYCCQAQSSQQSKTLSTKDDSISDNLNQRNIYYQEMILKTFIAPDIEKIAEQLSKNYNIYFGLNPYYLRGDFNGDGINDIALLIENKEHKVGISITHGSSNESYVLGAGTDFYNGGSDFKWMGFWCVYSKQEAEPGPGESAPLKLKGEGIMVEKIEAASAIIYWDGTKYNSYQQLD